MALSVIPHPARRVFDSVVFVNRLDSGGSFEMTPRTTGVANGKSPADVLLFKTFYRLRPYFEVGIQNRNTAVVLIGAERG
jgi:hypothetical protein